MQEKEIKHLRRRLAWVAQAALFLDLHYTILHHCHECHLFHNHQSGFKVSSRVSDALNGVQASKVTNMDAISRHDKTGPMVLKLDMVRVIAPSLYVIRVLPESTPFYNDIVDHRIQLRVDPVRLVFWKHNPDQV